jgi:exodeoxyribonuclease VII large subunit
VVIIRGGGATSDLSGFDTLALAENVAQFPIPIITGIGHDRDESILDMVSHRRVKTPTAAAALLIENLKRVADRIEDARQRIPALALQAISNSRHRVEMAENRLSVAIDRRLTSQKHRLENITIQLQGYDPQRLLSRGYSITLHHGRAVRDPAQLRPGDEIETRVEKGTLKSIIK